MKLFSHLPKKDEGWVEVKRAFANPIGHRNSYGSIFPQGTALGEGQRRQGGIGAN